MTETNILEKLKQDVKSRKGSFVLDMNQMWRDVSLYRLKWSRPNSSRLQWRAATMAELAQIVPIMINPHWSLAGEHLNPSQNIVWGLRSNLPIEEKQRQLAAIGYEDCYDAILALENTYFSQQSGTVPGEVPEELWNGHPAPEHNEVFWSHGWKENHSIRNYAMLLRDGYGGLRKRLETELAAHPITAADYPLRENFLRGAMFICDTGLTIGHRYAELAATMATEAEDKSERYRLKNMAECSRRTVENGATNFRDAVQLLWFGHLITCAEDGINANSLGRIDQFLYPWYRQDIDAGRITREDAVELMIELALKLYLDYDVQAITLGGCDATGKCAVNDLSYVILEATECLGELRDLAVRISSDTPVEFLRACSRLVIRGGGIPFFFNDECFIPALSERGIALDDARDYAPIGCVELTIPGKTNPHAVSGWFNLAKCLELTLFNGIDPVNNVQMGPCTGDLTNFRDFNAFYQAFQQQVEYFSARMIYHCRRGEMCQRQFAPLPGWSLLTDNCITRGRDITDGGAVYNYHSICLMGIPDAADALTAIKQLIFDEKSLSSNELLTALRQNFSGNETLRRKLLDGVPKYGNSQDAPDQAAAKLTRDFIALMDSWSEPENRIFVHLFTFRINLEFGKKVGALPDGRMAGEPLAYSLSAHQGRDRNGLTALLGSLAKMPHREAAAGSAAIIDLHPSLLPDPESPELLVQLLESIVKMGIGQIQWNVVSAERLEQARRDPEHYGNIPVRVAGYSQLFKLIDPELQKHIIARHKHRRG